METLILPSAPTKKWGVKKTNRPKFARFKLFVQYYNGSAPYPSFDYTKIFIRGVEEKIKNEFDGMNTLIEFALSLPKRERDYRYANLFCNLTNDLDVTKKNYDLLVASFSESKGITWKKKLFWIEEIYPLYTKIFLDVAKTKKYNSDIVTYNEFETSKIK